MAQAQSSALLPDAPAPVSAVAPGAGSFMAAGGSALEGRDAADPPRRKPRWRPWVNPGQRVRALTAHEKLEFWLHQEVTPYSPAPTFLGAGYEQLVNGDPKYGSDSGAFGERLGAAFVRDATMRFFVSSAMPAVLHEDPRYYRRARGSIVGRGLWAGEQALVTRTDGGRRTVNYSDLLGHLAAAALTPAYYPAPSRSGRVVAEVWATSIAGDAGNNLFLEFMPSLRDRWRRHRRRMRERIGSAPVSSHP